MSFRPKRRKLIHIIVMYIKGAHLSAFLYRFFVYRSPIFVNVILAEVVVPVPKVFISCSVVPTSSISTIAVKDLDSRPTESV